MAPRPARSAGATAELLLAKPVARHQLLLGKFLGCWLASGVSLAWFYLFLGTLAGALLMQTIASGCTQLGLRNPVQDIILGVIIVAAVTVDQIRQRRAILSA